MPKKKLRVLILYDFPIKGGGSGYYVRYLANKLIEKFNVTIGIVLPDTNLVNNKFTQFNVPIAKPPVFIGRPGLENSKRYSDITPTEIADHLHKYIKSSIEAVESFKPDLIHVHHLGINAWAARYIKAIYGIPYIITSHGSCLASIMNDKRYHALSLDAIRAANYVTAVSGDSRYKIIKAFGKDISKKLRTIPGGVLLSSFPESLSETQKNGLRKKFDLPEGPLVFFTGRLITEKGVDYLINAAHDIKANIVIIGDGNMKDAYKKMIKKMNAKNVHLLGYVDHEELIKLYYLADVYVAPSIWDDPMPLTIIEAMAAKCAMVVTKKGGIPLAVKDNYNGLFVRPKSSKDIAQKVNKLLANDDLREKMGERSREIVERKFTWTHIAARFNKMYESI